MIGVIDCIYLSRLMRTAFSISTAIEEKGQLPPYKTRERKCVFIKLLGTWVRVVNKSGEDKAT